MGPIVMNSRKLRYSLAALFCLLLPVPGYAQGTLWDKWYNAGNQAWLQGRKAEAEQNYREALKEAERFGEKDRRLATTLQTLALTCKATGRYAEAEALFRRLLAVKEKQKGANHPDVAYVFDQIAQVYKEQKDYIGAESFLKRALEIREKALGEKDLAVSSTLTELGDLYRMAGRYAEAEAIYTRVLPMWEKEAKGHRDPAVQPVLPIALASKLENLAQVYVAQGKYAEAEPLYIRAIKIWEQGIIRPLHPKGQEWADVWRSLGNTRLNVASLCTDLASLYEIQGRLSDAESLYQRALKIRQEELGPDRPEVAASLNNLAFLHTKQQRYGDAQVLYKGSVEILTKRFGPEHPNVAAVLGAQAVLSSLEGRQDEAQSLFQRTLAIYEKSHGPESLEVAVTLENYATLLKAMGRAGDAAAASARAKAIREKHASPNPRPSP